MDYDEEDRRDFAARTIQRSYRSITALRNIRKLIRNNYCKVRDRKTGEIYYKNKLTLQLYIDKPPGIGNEDLPSPRELQAPEDYVVGDRDGLDGYVVMVTCSTFNSSNDKIPKLDRTLVSDHTLLESTFGNEFVTKIPPENVTAVMDPTSTSFKEAFEPCRKASNKSNFLVVYLCTHALTVTKGDRRQPNENCYFAMSDTVWTGPQDIAKTSVSLSKLVEIVNRIPCKMKVIILNVVHSKKVSRSFFSNKAVYPPPDLYTKLANMSHSVVIGACTIATSMTELIQHTPYLDVEEKLAILKSSQKKQKKKTNESGSSREGALTSISVSVDPSSPAVDSSGKLKPETTTSSPAVDSSGKLKPETTTSPSKSKKSKKDKGVLDIYKLTDAEKSAKILEYIKDWNSKEESKGKNYSKPEPPDPTWIRDESTNHEYKLTLPTEEEVLRYESKLRMWNLWQIVGPPIRYIQQKYTSIQNTMTLSPAQCCLYGDTLSYFGRAIITALKGGASDINKPVVTARALFKVLYARIKIDINNINEQEVKVAKMAYEEQVNKQSEDDSITAEPKFSKSDYNAMLRSIILSNQSPIIIVPRGKEHLVDNPVAFRCGPPPAPERPFVVKVGYDQVLLEWFNPPFDGVPPIKYIIFMRNNTRIYHKWTPITYNGTITWSKFLVKNLVPGIPCQFRVQSMNNGGWGMFSEATFMCFPGEMQQPLSSLKRWKKIELGGVMAILDRLTAHPYQRLEHVTGLGKIVSHGLKMRGFKKEIGHKVAMLAWSSLHTFKDDCAIAPSCFMAMALAMQNPSGKDPVNKKTRIFLVQNNVTQITDHYLAEFRRDANVINALSYLRSKLPTGSVNFPAELPPDIEGKDDDASDSDDSIDINTEYKVEVDEAKDAINQLKVF